MTYCDKLMGKAGACSSGLLKELHSKGKLVALPRKYLTRSEVESARLVITTTAVL
jgi:hypothetical protein